MSTTFVSNAHRHLAAKMFPSAEEPGRKFFPSRPELCAFNKWSFSILGLLICRSYLGIKESVDKRIENS